MRNDEHQAQTQSRPMFRTIGKPIAPPLVLGVIAMGLGSFVAVLLASAGGLFLGGLLSLGGIVAAVIGIGRLADAVQYLALRERDREHEED